jgi:U3 small nucleolar RNA-associated protein 10
VSDSLKPKPGISQVLLGIGNEGASDPHEVAEVLLRSLSYLLKHSSLGPKMAVVYASDGKDAAAIIRSIFSQILEQILTLGDTVQGSKPLTYACGDILGSVLGTLSLVDFLDTVEELLQRPDDDLRRKVLRLLESRVRQNPERDSASQNRVLNFVSVLVDIVQNSPDILLKHAAVACLDRISEKYGKKDTGKVVVAAQVIAGDACIGQSDDRIRVMGVLCLASMAEVLGEAIIPALPDTLSRSLSLLEGSLKDGEENEKLHNAVFSLLSALFIQVPFMLSGTYLDRILQLSLVSAKSGFPAESDDARRDMLKLLARKADVKESFGAVERNWAFAVKQGPTAVREALDVISIAIEKHPKSATVKNVGILSKFFHKAFDLRREQVCSEDAQYEESELEDVENIVSDVAIKMIYKLNDTSFRPMFVELVEWATNGLPKKDALGRLMRLTSFYKFLESFFATLKVCTRLN